MSETNKPRYFSYDPDSCVDAHESADDARKCAEETVAYYRDNAGDGWSEHVENVCWGVILSEVEETERRPRTDEDGCNPECDFVVDYDLTEAQDPFAELATLRAKVAALEANDRRYRWLRGKITVSSWGTPALPMAYIREEETDQAIDAAMGASND